MSNFYKTKTLKIYDEFRYAGRSFSSLITIFYLIKYFKFKKILEVGFLEGQTFGLMVEASDTDTHLVTMDPFLQLEVYNRHYTHDEVTKNKKIEILETTFEEFSSSDKFDFILIDSGMPNDEVISRFKNRTYSHQEPLLLDVDRSEHFIESLKLCHDKTIIALDDYIALDQITNNVLAKQDMFVPFLADDSTLYFHKKENNCVEFLDEYLEKLGPMHDLVNIDYKGHVIKKVSMKKQVLIDLGNLHPGNLKYVDKFWHNLLEHTNI